MNLITPEHISHYISFQYGNPQWEYDYPGNKDIPTLQAEGAAKIWNILQQRNIALLADEVGMGKTYQALAIIITLWLEKPNAKILLYAPNETVAGQWLNEYETFIRYHYKFNDDKIKSSINGQPLRQAVYCENQLELLKYINQGWPSLYVCKTSSLSNFLSKKITQEELDSLRLNIIKNVDEHSGEDEKAKWMYRFAKKCNDFICRKLVNKNSTSIGTDHSSPFDLIVFDEAHYLRNANADTNRSLVAHAFFAKRDIRNYEGQKEEMAFLSRKVLLLTATPNHSSSKNIETIVSIFSNDFRGAAASDILNQICVRRFRRLHNKTKHQYRKELDEPVKMSDIREKLFFAMYQRALVKHKAALIKKNKEASRKQNPYKLLYGYLEGFEFLPTKRSEIIKPSGDPNQSGDFEDADDKRIIQDLAEVHYRVYKIYPLHPKYNKTVENLSPIDINGLHSEKKVVFVRRIPSVRELSRRVMEAYDEQFSRILLEARSPDIPALIKNWDEYKLRKHFATVAKSNYDDTEETQEIDNHHEKQDEDISDIVYSKYYSLFTIKKEGNFKTTDCSNFRNRFLKEFQPFSLFMHPGSDYLGAPYTFTSYLYQDDKRNYAVSARKFRVEKLGRKKKDSLFSYISFPDDLHPKQAKEQTYETLFTLFIRNVKDSENSFLQDSLHQYKAFSEIEKEAFANYLTKGLLFASSFLIVFYAKFKSISRNKNVKHEILYYEFCKSIERDMMVNGLALLIAQAISTFQVFYKKELGLTEESLLSEKWTFLNNTNPVFPVSADTKRGSILKAFNTPFYPNVLVSTSVLQEGVNLHYHCNEVIHYGLAWTQGDNEQRVGRVDRLNGKMEGQLMRNPQRAILPIHYPYLKNTIDEDQTARFILRKKEAEKLIDQFIPIEQSNEINYLERVVESDWKKCFNNPEVASYENKDPFPVVYERDFKNINLDFKEEKQLTTSTSRKTILEPILSALARHYKKEFYIYENKPGGDKKIFAIKHIRANERHQPVIAEFEFYEPGLHILQKPVYCLRIKTPIYRRGYKYDNLTRFGKQKYVYADNPVLKIGFDNSRRDEFKYFVCADLPVFNTDNQKLNLSDKELEKVLSDIIAFADDLENTYMNNYDISNEIIEGNLPEWKQVEHQLSLNRGNESDQSWRSKNEYLFKEKQCLNRFESTNHIYYKNMEERIIKYYRTSDADFRSVGFYKNDALAEETKLYKYIFENENI